MLKTVNALQASIINRLKEYPWTFQGVNAGVNVPFIYTIGVSQYEAELGMLPELIMSSDNLEGRQMQDIMHTLAAQWAKSKQVTLGLIDPVEGDRGTYKGLKVVKVNQSILNDTHTCQVHLINPRETYTVVQVMYPDALGKYPDEEGYNLADYPQEALPQ